MGLLVDGKSKWVVISAGVLAFASLSETQQRILCGKLKAAGGDDYAMARLIESARLGHLLADLASEEAQRQQGGDDDAPGSLAKLGPEKPKPKPAPNHQLKGRQAASRKGGESGDQKKPKA